MTTPLSFAQRDGFIWYDGQFVPWKDATLHVLNHGLHYGSCVFEGVRVYNGKIFKNHEHNVRFHQSAEMLGFRIPYSVETLDKACEETVKKQGIVNGYLRPVAWRGSEQMAILANKSTIHVAIASWELATYFDASAKEKGLRLTISKWKRPSPETAPSHSKAAGLYMICTLSKNSATDEGFDDALMFDWRGQVAESTGANIFFIIDGVVHTPTPDCFLNGITRQTVIDLAKKEGLTVVERAIFAEDVAKAQEVFLTGTAAEITPVASIRGKAGLLEIDAKFTVGSTTKTLMQRYDQLVRN